MLFKEKLSKNNTGLPSPFLVLFLNATSWSGKFIRLPCKTTAVLASVFLGCAIMGLAVTVVFLDRLRGTYHEACGLQERPRCLIRSATRILAGFAILGTLQMFY